MAPPASKAAPKVSRAEMSSKISGWRETRTSRAVPLPATAPSSPPAAMKPNACLASLTAKASSAVSQNWTKAREENSAVQT